MPMSLLLRSRRSARRPCGIGLSLPVVLALAGCTAPTTGIVRLGDGLMKAASVQAAETFCRSTGDPTRLIEHDPALPDGGVLFRCD